MVMSNRKFVCANCKALFEMEAAVTNCRLCNEIYCEECMDEKGVCVPCGQKTKEFIIEDVAGA
jgi:Zn finger protein HypA/HybF involved in hydrogenase expression